MSKINFLTVAVIFLLLLNAGTLYVMFRWHHQRPEVPAGGNEGPAAYIIATLHLDAQQQDRFARLREQHQQAVRSIRDDDKRLHDAYFSLLKTEHPDKTKVDSLSALIGAQEQLLSKTTFEHFEQLRALCREDQKKQFDATIDEIARRMARPHPPEGKPDGPPEQTPPPPGGPPR